ATGRRRYPAVRQGRDHLGPGATLGFKSMKTAYATIKGIEVMRALRKGQASAFYYGDPLGEMRLVSRVFEM
ncbi:hypothetical protein AAIH62_36235, partial [Pseudomonas aeruginosa]